MRESQDAAGRAAVNLPVPVRDRYWHRALMTAVRFRAWLLGSVYTSGSLAVVLRDDGRLLLVKPRYRRGWGLVGGYMRRREQSIDAMRREMHEEVGFAGEIAGPIASYVQ